MRIIMVVAAVVALLVLPGCSAQDVSARAQNLRSAASAAERGALALSNVADNADALVIAVTPLLEQIRVWAPERASLIEQAIAAGQSGQTIVALVQAASSDFATRAREAATQMEADASASGIDNAITIGLGILAAFGIFIPSPAQRGRLRLADNVVKLANQPPVPIPAPMHPGAVG